MSEIPLTIGTTVALPKSEFDGLLNGLRQLGYETIGPQIKDEAVIYDSITNLADLPRGYTSEQDAGKYRLVYAGHNNYFDVTPGAQSWKKYFFPPRSEMTAFRRDPENPRRWLVEEPKAKYPLYALIGVRPCELAALHIQDRVFLREDLKDPIYRARRQGAFIIAVNCLHPGGTCFCASMETGPDAKTGYDLCMTELDDDFLVQIGSEAGRMALATQEWHPAAAFLLNQAKSGLEKARQNMGRSIANFRELPEALLRDMENPRYDQIAKRCMSCSNCTLVCPTCFCWDTREVNELNGQSASRERVWDSCFNLEYSYVFGGNSRPLVRSRYRQWITHKLGSWWKQFDTAGCVGCGRCISWCPAAIDFTVEAAELRKEVKP